MPTIVLQNVKAAQTEIALVSLWSTWRDNILNTEYILWPGIFSNFYSLSCLIFENITITIIIKSTFQMEETEARRDQSNTSKKREGWDTNSVLS